MVHTPRIEIPKGLCYDELDTEKMAIRGDSHMNQMLKKKDRISKLIMENKGILKCPLCGKQMQIQASSSLTCKSKHCFDLSKKGYLNLLTSHYDAVYSKDLFEARHQVCRAGFFDPLMDVLEEIIKKHQHKVGDRKLAVFDAGCGEGSHLSSLTRRLVAADEGKSTEKETGKKEYFFAGADISKESIHIAAGSDGGDILWCVADLAKLPFHNGSFDVILNILSPANYLEFTRVLRNDGIIVKVFPDSRYLMELRNILYHGKENISYSNDRMVDYFAQKLTVTDTRKITYSFEISRELFPQLMKMTPLTWGADEARLEVRDFEMPTHITVDLTVMTGIMKE